MVFTRQNQRPKLEPRKLICYFLFSLDCPFRTIFALFNCLPQWLKVYYRNWTLLCTEMDSLAQSCPSAQIDGIQPEPTWNRIVTLRWRNLCFRVVCLSQDEWDFSYHLTVGSTNSTGHFTKHGQWKTLIRYFQQLGILLPSLDRMCALDDGLWVSFNENHAIVIHPAKLPPFVPYVMPTSNHVEYFSPQLKICRTEEQFANFIQLSLNRPAQGAA